MYVSRNIEHLRVSFYLCYGPNIVILERIGVQLEYVWDCASV